jgi:hypothetical protein
MSYSLLLVNNTTVTARYPNCAGRVSSFVFPTLDDLKHRTFTTSVSWRYIGQSKNNVQWYSEIYWTPMSLAMRKSIPCLDITVDQFYVASTTIHYLTFKTPSTSDGSVASPLPKQNNVNQFTSWNIRPPYAIQSNDPMFEHWKAIHIVMPEHSLRFRIQRICIAIPFIKGKHHMFITSRSE